MTSPPAPDIVAAVARAVPAVGALITGVQNAGQVFADAVNLITGGDDARTIAERQARQVQQVQQYDAYVGAAIAANNPDLPPATVAAQVAAMQAASNGGGGGFLPKDDTGDLFER